MLSEAELILSVITLWFLVSSQFFRDGMGPFNFALLNTHSVRNKTKGKIPKDTYFSIPLITVGEVEEIVSNLNTNKAVGLDDINAKYLKISATVISNDIADIINRSLCEQTFPDIWKAAKVIPLHKSGNKDAVDNYRPISILSSNAVDNYRPISILSSVSKVMEKHIHKHFYSFLTQHNLLSFTQSGFRKMHSCDTALTFLINDWYNSFDNGDVIVLSQST